MEQYKGLPVFSIDFTDESFWNSISIVQNPAIERNFIQLSKQADIKFKINEEKREISGPAIIPGQMIYRNDEKGAYYITFSKETIKKMAIEFFKENVQNNGNVEHSFKTKGVTFFESYLINKERGIAPVEFSDLEDGTWIVSAHIENDEIWKLIQDGSLQGFSIDCAAAFEQEEKEIDTLEEFYNYLKNNNINK